jgi:WS/DGAT/MGAT family acyltransferase
LNLGLAPKTIFNDSITNQRSYSTLSLPLADIKGLGKRVGGTVNTIVMAMCSIALHHFLKERGLLPREALIAMVPVSLRAEGDSAMNNQVSMVRVDLATDMDDLPARFSAIHASSEAAKAVVRELKPVLGVNVPITGSPWLMTGLASLLGRSSLPSRFPAVGNVTISNVPGPPMPLYMAGARMVHYYPVSIPYHGSALNITVHSYAGLLEFGLTACRRILSQDESYELIEHLRAALREIEALPTVAETPIAEQVVPVPKEPSETYKKKKSAAVKQSEAASQKLSAANKVAGRTK